MKIANYWLALAVTALGLSGLFTILLIIGRTTNILPTGVFPPTLIVHVNLDVLVWLLAMTASYFNTENKIHNPIPFFIASAGTALIVISPFTGTGAAYENNYIPIYDNLLFKTGIGLFLAAVAYEAITTLISKAGYLAKSVALLLVFAFVAFGISYWSIADKTSSHYLYEYMFWGGGHIMQFAYVQIMLIAWLVLAKEAIIKIPASTRTLYFIFALPVIFVLFFTIFIYASAEVETTQHVQLFTQEMIFGTGIAAIPLGLLLVIGLLITGRWNLYSITLSLSIIFFLIGGILGNKAAAQVADGSITTIIPSHYHFSSVAVTIALMGYIFSRLNLKKTRLALWQIVLYAIGQFIYFSGFAILGGHGAARKTPGLDLVDMDDSSRKMVAHIMDSGGSLSLIGGIMFVIIVIKHFKHLKSTAAVER